MDNFVYKRQLAIIAFIASLTFKIVMLPQYLTASAGSQAWISMAVLMSLDIMAFVVIYNVVKRQNIMLLKIPKALNALLMILIFASSFIKFIVLSCEALNFYSVNLFENSRWLYLMLAFLPLVSYLAYKGTNTIARVSQVLLWIILPTMIFSSLFFKASPDFAGILPVFGDGAVPVFNGVGKHFVWFGDFTPLLFMTIKTEKKRDFSIVTAFVFAYVLSIAFALLFTALYGESGVIVSNAFARIARFNVASDLLGGVDFPIVIAWLAMSLVKLSILMYAMVECGSFIFKRRGFICVFVSLASYLVVVLRIQNVENSYKFASGWISWVVMAIEYGVPLIYLIISQVQHFRRKKGMDKTFNSKNLRQGVWILSKKNKAEVCDLLKTQTLKSKDGGENEKSFKE